MNNNTTHEKRDPMEAKFDEVPGYKKVFYIAFAIGVLYLASVFIFGSRLMSAGGGH